MKRVAIIQARMGSTRLPGKALRDICGKPMIHRIIDRVSQSPIDEIILATTNDPRDDELCQYVEKLGVRSYRGETLDLMKRYYEAALKSNADFITKISGDCPCVDPYLITLTMNCLGLSHFCYTAGFPLGVNAYSFTFDRLKWAVDNLKTPAEKEFHHQYMSAGGYVIYSKWDIHGFNFMVDTGEDLEFIHKAYSNLGDYFTHDDLVKWAMELAVSEFKDGKRVRHL